MQERLLCNILKDTSVVVTMAPPCGKTYAMTPNAISIPLHLTLTSKPTEHDTQAIFVWNFSHGFATFLNLDFTTLLKAFSECGSPQVLNSGLLFFILLS